MYIQDRPSGHALQRAPLGRDEVGEVDVGLAARLPSATARAAEAPLPWGQPMTRSSSPELMSIGLGALITVLNAQAGRPTCWGRRRGPGRSPAVARRQPGGRRPADLRDAQGREVADREVEPEPAAGHDVVAGEVADRERGARAGAGGRQVDREAALREAEAGRPADGRLPGIGAGRDAARGAAARRLPEARAGRRSGRRGRRGRRRLDVGLQQQVVARRSAAAADSPTGAPRRRRRAPGTSRPGTRRCPGRRSAPPSRRPAGRSRCSRRPSRACSPGTP